MAVIKEVVAKAEIIDIKFRLKVTKTQSKDKASIGEFVKYYHHSREYRYYPTQQYPHRGQTAPRCQIPKVELPDRWTKDRTDALSRWQDTLYHVCQATIQGRV